MISVIVVVVVKHARQALIGINLKKYVLIFVLIIIIIIHHNNLACHACKIALFVHQDSIARLASLDSI